MNRIAIFRCVAALVSAIAAAPSAASAQDAESPIDPRSLVNQCGPGSDTDSLRSRREAFAEQLH